MATMDTNQSLSHNTTSKVQFNSEVFDTDGAYDTSNYRFTVPSGEAGKYHKLHLVFMIVQIPYNK